MENNNGVMILLIAIMVSVFLLVCSRLAAYLTGFDRETRNIRFRMRRAADRNEADKRHRELVCHKLCLLPFVSESSAERLYDRLFYRPRRAARQSSRDGLSHLLAPSLIGACLCAVCLCGASWAWFSASASSMTVIQSASFSASVTVTNSDDTIADPELKPVENSAGVEASLSAGTYLVEITPAEGQTTTGYCQVQLGDKTFYTVEIEPEDQIHFQLSLTDEAAELTVTPIWGSYSNVPSEQIIGENKAIAVTAADGIYLVEEDALPVMQPLTKDETVPAQTEDGTDSGEQAASGAASGEAASDSAKPEGTDAGSEPGTTGDTAAPGASGDAEGGSASGSTDSGASGDAEGGSASGDTDSGVSGGAESGGAQETAE